MYTNFLTNVEDITMHRDDAILQLALQLPLDRTFLQYEDHKFLSQIRKKHNNYHYIISPYTEAEDDTQDLYCIKRTIHKSQVYYCYIRVGYNNRYTIAFAQDIEAIIKSAYFLDYITRLCVSKQINCLQFFIVNSDNMIDMATVRINLNAL